MEIRINLMDKLEKGTFFIPITVGFSSNPCDLICTTNVEVTDNNIIVRNFEFSERFGLIGKWFLNGDMKITYAFTTDDEGISHINTLSFVHRITDGTPCVKIIDK